MFIVHDASRKPYKDNYLNFLQSFSSRLLLLVLICNGISSVSFVLDVTKVHFVFDAVEILSVMELILYALVPMSLPLWKVWIIISKKRNTNNKKDF